MPSLQSGSGYAVWKPKAEVFLGLKGLKEALMDFATEKQWLKVTKRVAEWAAADKAELLSALFGDDSEEEGKDDDGQSSVSASSSDTASVVKTPRPSTQEPLKEKEAEMRKQATAMIKRSEMAYGHIFGALPNDVALMVKVVPQGWAHGLWMWLQRKFQSTESDNVNALLREWHEIRQAEGESFDLYRARVDELYVRLAAAKEKPSPRAYAYAMVNSLLPKYDLVVMALETGMLLNVQDYAKISWDDVAKIINMHERKIHAQASKDAETTSAKAMAMQHYHRKGPWVNGGASGSTARGGHTPAAGEDRADRRLCWKCGQPGHVKATCPNKASAAAAEAGGKGAGSDTQQGKRQGQVSVALGAKTDSLVTAPQSLGGIAFTAAEHAAGPVMSVGTAKGKGQKQIGVDSMASVHVSPDIDMFLELKPCEPFLVTGMDGGELEACFGGRLELHLDSNGKQSTVILDNVYYHPNFAASLLSLGCLTEVGWAFHSDEDSTFIVTPAKHKVSLRQDHRVSMLHCTTTSVTSGGPVYNVQEGTAVASEERMVMTRVDELVRLHEQLGHVGFDRMVVMLEKQATEGMGTKSASTEVLKEARARVLQCKACTQGKGSRTAFGHRGLDKGTQPGEVLHMDTNHVTVIDELGQKVKSYGVNIIDPFTGARFKQHLATKDLIARAVIEIIKLIQRQSDWKVKRLFTDGGTEFVNGAMKEFVASEGMQMHNSPARTQQLDGVAERVVRTGKDMERTMLLHAGLDAALYYKFASHHSVFVWNRTYVSPQTGLTL